MDISSHILRNMSDITYEELILSSICREKAFPKSDITYEELIHASSASDG